MMGGGLTFADITPDGDLDGDGLTNLQEYIAGTYAWDADDTLWLNLVEIRGQNAIFEFLAINGRSYSILQTNDLKAWTPVDFRLPALDAPGQLRSSYFAPDVRVLGVEVPVGAAADQVFYRLKVR
jgi:hypothetical protein